MYFSARDEKAFGSSTEKPERPDPSCFTDSTKLVLLSLWNSRPHRLAHHTSLSAWPQVFFLYHVRASSGSVPGRMRSMSPRGMVLEVAKGK
ncbi:unnamed protein product [Pseudo-nitzschia multistriata]|uniref:Uncharacterized protein n=1 Tax=Pseudo-nitzschia multistriata TaxID=183589 RepID=A0A448Z070_9STRA|nr:unnamed protein product [Pseudo-nitzschia multistriata]